MNTLHTSVMLPATTVASGSADFEQLDPNVLSLTAEKAARALIREGESDNTVRSYQSGARYWAAWHALRYGQAIALPVPVATVCWRRPKIDHQSRVVPIEN